MKTNQTFESKDLKEQKEYAEHYEEFSELELFNIKILKKIAKHLKEPILDVGCFTGRKAAFFYENGYKDISGCDISNNSIKQAKKSYPFINFFQHDMVKSSTSEKYNSVICFQTIEHIFNYHRFLKNIVGSLNNGGVAVIETPNACSIITRARLLLGDARNFTGNIDESHIRFFSKTCLEKAMEKQGMTIVQSFGYNIRPIVKPIEFISSTSWKEVLVVIAKKQL